ncbi:CAP domain-containing protein [Phyllobacterium leguminum]|uniref:Secreted protein n=1 Tax=Phyllobacterium leguminum TaxID=314237 RepID=A0A318T0V1_9HYPH|nr:CAP domain-containing protein [Phyllobacterium leguminum]PYE86376.1 secreted protein [Phyllobacterium leguminum]
MTIENSGFAVNRRNFLTLAGAMVLSAAPLANEAIAAEDPTALFNIIRKQHGLPLLATEPKLEKAALYQAKRMASYDKIGHSVGWGNDFVSRLRQFGIHGPAAENVAAGQRNTAAVFEAWMNSPGHRKNMLDPDFYHYGLAWATPEAKPRYIYWAMELGV